MEYISALIADDEPLAREGLILHLQDAPDIKVVSVCSNGTEAMQNIIDLQPDVVFLDIEMPGMSGIDLIEKLKQQQVGLPIIIFVTAYKEFAVDAFEFQAFDYLLKPFSEDRFQECINKLRNGVAQHTAFEQQNKLDRLLSQKTGKSLYGFITNLEQDNNIGVQQLQQTISLKSGTEWLRIELESILWIEAAGDYMCVHTDDNTHIIRKTLKQFEKELDKSHFIRISRSAIINISKVTKLTPNSNGEYIALLCSGYEVKVGRKYKTHLNELRS